MADPKLEEVFKLSGIPTYTFVEPVEYQKLKVAARTPGRPLVVEGPSGIGKTTSVTKALEELGLIKNALRLSARRAADVELIEELPAMNKLGVVVVDDFHRLNDACKAKIADLMKVLADEEDETSKLIIIGINKTGDALVEFGRDLNNRIETFRLEANPTDRVRELIESGEGALNITINTKDDIARQAQGSFHIAQMLCHETCLWSKVTERTAAHVTTTVSVDVVVQRVMDNLDRAFFELARKFAAGPRLRREGRAPYLHILNWLATGNDWSIQLDQAMAIRPEHKSSVGQVVDKGYLEEFISANDEFRDVIHYEPRTRVLSVEDPKFVFFIRNLLWSKFAKQVGYLSTDFEGKYDFALSFAGADRPLAERLFEELSKLEFAVFYDKNEQHRILAEDVEDYLAPIYRSEAKFVICLLSRSYPKRIWTKFESDQFKQRFGDSAVIPIWFSDAEPGMFDESGRVGGCMFQVTEEIAPQVSEIGGLLARKIAEHRVEV